MMKVIILARVSTEEQKELRTHCRLKLNDLKIILKNNKKL